MQGVLRSPPTQVFLPWLPVWIQGCPWLSFHLWRRLLRSANTLPPSLLSSCLWTFPALDLGIIDSRTLAHRGPGSRVPGPGTLTAGVCINC